MTSEEVFQQKYPLVVIIMTDNGIAPDKYSVSTYTLSTNDGFGCQVSPTKGNSSLFTQGIQDQLVSSGIVFKNNLT